MGEKWYACLRNDAIYTFSGANSLVDSSQCWACASTENRAISALLRKSIEARAWAAYVNGEEGGKI